MKFTTGPVTSVTAAAPGAAGEAVCVAGRKMYAPLAWLEPLRLVLPSKPSYHAQLCASGSATPVLLSA